jgi:hypothetical protein
MTGRWFSPGPPVSSTNKTDRHDITEILLKVALKHHDHQYHLLLFKKKYACHFHIYWNNKFDWMTGCHNVQS